MKVPRKRLVAGLLAMALAICPIPEWGGQSQYLLLRQREALLPQAQRRQKAIQKQETRTAK